MPISYPNQRIIKMDPRKWTPPIQGGSLLTDRQIRGTPFTVDTFQGKICVVRCIHAQDGKAWIWMSKKTHTNPLSRREIESLRKNPNVAAVSATCGSGVGDDCQVHRGVQTHHLRGKETRRIRFGDPATKRD